MQELLELEKRAMDVIKSRYLLCILVSQRIHQLEKGAQPCIEVGENEYDSPKTYYELALREIIEGNMDLEQIPTNRTRWKIPLSLKFSRVLYKKKARPNGRAFHCSLLSLTEGLLHFAFCIHLPSPLGHP